MKKRRLLLLLVFMLLILFMTYRFELKGESDEKNRLFSSLFSSLIHTEGDRSTESLISVSDLKTQLKKENIELIAISDQELDEFIPDSSRVTISDITTTKNGIQGLIAGQKQIDDLLSKKGLEREDTIIVYDDGRSLYATRLWWTLKAYGHDHVKVLDGGLRKWKREEYETVSVPKIERKTRYESSPLNKKMIATIDDIKNSLTNKEQLVVDVRTKEEYEAGHIPGAVNIPWTQTLNADGTFKKIDELQTLYESKGVTQDLNQIYTQCKKGLRASHTYFVLSELLGYENVSLYDGSWLEYSQSGLPVEKN